MYSSNKIFPNLQGTASEMEQSSLNQAFLLLPFPGIYLEWKPSVSLPSQPALAYLTHMTSTSKERNDLRSDI